MLRGGQQIRLPAATVRQHSSGFLKGSLVQKIRYFKEGFGFGSKDLDLLSPFGSAGQVSFMTSYDMHALRLYSLKFSISLEMSNSHKSLSNLL